MRTLLILCLLLSLPLLACAQPPRLLFDQGHRQAFVIEKTGPLQLGGLAGVMHEQGWKISVSPGELDQATLADVDALIISGAFRPLDPNEVDAITGFLQKGGRLAVMLHIYPPFLPLLQQLGVGVGNRVINEQQHRFDDKPIDFFVRDLKAHPLTRGLHQFAVYGGWPLKALDPQTEEIARCGPKAWVDVDNDQQLSNKDLLSPFAVLVSGRYGKGEFVVFGDDAIFQNQFLTGDNLELAKNLARWLQTGQQKLTAL